MWRKTNLWMQFEQKTNKKKKNCEQTNNCEYRIFIKSQHIDLQCEQIS